MRRQTHVNDIPVRDFVEVCLDYRQMGLGGYDSWGKRPDGAPYFHFKNAYKTHCGKTCYAKTLVMFFTCAQTVLKK